MPSYYPTSKVGGYREKRLSAEGSYTHPKSFSKVIFCFWLNIIIQLFKEILNQWLWEFIFRKRPYVRLGISYFTSQQNMALENRALWGKFVLELK